MSQPGLLSSLPIELILQIAEYLPSVQEKRDLLLTSRRLFTVLIPHILGHALSDEPAFRGFVGAAERGQLDSVRMFLRHDAASNGRLLDHDLKSTALFWACSRGHKDAVDLLLAAGADPSYPVKSVTALIEAIYYEHVDIVRTLLDTGKVDPNVPDEDGCTALHHAARCYSPDMIRLLVEVGKADVDAREAGGRTPLYYACTERNSTPAIVRVLVELGSDPGVRDQRGRTVEETLRRQIVSSRAAHAQRCRESIGILREASLSREESEGVER